jgi:hypothetical protein
MLVCSCAGMLAGLFQASLWILNPRASVNIMVRPPTLTNTTGYLFLEQCYSLAAQSYRPPSFGPAVSPGSDPEAGLLAPGWLVRYNLTSVLPSQGSLGGAIPLDVHAPAVVALQQQQAGAPSAVKYMRAGVLPDLAFSSPGGLAAVLAPQGIAAVVPDGGSASGGQIAVLASATTVLKASVLPRSLVLQVRWCPTSETLSGGSMFGIEHRLIPQQQWYHVDVNSYTSQLAVDMHRL